MKKRRSVTKLIAIIITCLLLNLSSSTGFAEEKKFKIKVTNEMIYEKLIKIEKRQAVFEEKFKQIDKRFEDIDKRFAEIDKRFEDMNRRFEELREDMNKRFEDMNKRFEDMNKRFEDMNKRIEGLIKLMGWIILGMFGLIGVLIGLLIWDRRTAVSVAVKESEKRLEEKFSLDKLPRLIEALKELAKKNKEVAEVLRYFNLL